jgi:hypothetical protein
VLESVVFELPLEVFDDDDEEDVVSGAVTLRLK